MGLTDAEREDMWKKSMRGYPGGGGSGGGGRELSTDEIKDALAAGNRAAAPLIEERVKMMRDWTPDAALSREQMTQILDAVVKVARETEKNLSILIDDVPKHWETHPRNERTIILEWLDKVPAFQNLIAKADAPTVVPGFRDFIKSLLSRIEDAVITMGYVAHVLPNWLRMVNMLSTLYNGAIAAIHGIVKLAKALGGAAVKAAEALPTFVKWLGIGALAVGGVWAVSKARTSTRKAA